MLRSSSVFVLAMAAAAASAQGLTTPSLIRLPQAPLRLVSTTSTTTDFLDQVVVENVSTKTVTAFRLGLIKAVPANCAAQEFIAPEEKLPVEYGDIVPGASHLARSLRLSPIDVAAFRDRHHATDVDMQLTVVAVAFADGSTWELQRSSRLFDEHLYQQDASMRCPAHPK